jgi:hypothetical protein
MWKVANLVLPAILVEKRSRRIPFQGESYSKKKRERWYRFEGIIPSQVILHFPSGFRDEA